MLEDHFIPPIKSRTDQELLQIVGAPQKWTTDAVNLSIIELKSRKIPSRKIEMATYLESKKEKIKALKKAKESYNIFDFIFSPTLTLIEIIFSWELKKDGFDRKARQQKNFRIFLLVLSILILTFIKIASYF